MKTLQVMEKMGTFKHGSCPVSIQTHVLHTPQIVMLSQQLPSRGTQLIEPCLQPILLVTCMPSQHSRSLNTSAGSCPTIPLPYISNSHTARMLLQLQCRTRSTPQRTSTFQLPQKHACLSLENNTQQPHFTAHNQGRCLVSQPCCSCQPPSGLVPGPRTPALWVW